MQFGIPCSALLLALTALPCLVAGGQGRSKSRARPIVIAHRGASGYLPEHTLEAKSLAYAMGADFIEQDVVLSKDNVPIVLHDIHLDTVSDVAMRYPDRRRDDGRFYAADFTLAEIKTMRAHERIDLKTGRAVFPGRFPVGKASFEIPTLAEEIELIQGLNRVSGRNVGIYVEIKAPAWHRKQGRDISPIVLKTLAEYGYRQRGDNAYVQCFDARECRRIRHELRSDLKLVQLIGSNDWKESDTDFDQLRAAAGVARIAEYADGIGPWLRHVVSGRDDAGHPIITPLVALAHQHGLVVHPYTFRVDELPAEFRTFDDALQAFVVDAKIDGLFTDFPDRAVKSIQNLPSN